MNILFIALLLQFQPLPPRAQMENPAATSAVPAKLKKDYDKLWSRFTTGKDDPKLMKDLDNLLKKQKNFDPALTIQAYIELHRGNNAAAVQKFEQVLAINPDHRVAQSYVAEFAFESGDYARANEMYSRLLAADHSRSDLEMKRQKALLLATESLLRSAKRAEEENRLADAEKFYREALKIVPREPILHLRLADLLARAKKPDEAAAERKIADDLLPRRPAAPRRDDEAKVIELEDLGRWGNEIELFREIRVSPAVTRAQLAVLIVRYFPQITELRQNSRVITDLPDSWAGAEIQTVVGLGLIETLPNHTFAPAAPVTRGDFASAMARLARLLSLPAAGNAPVTLPDVASTNAGYADIQLVLGYSLLTLQDSGTFNVSGEVSGKEAVNAVDRLVRTFQQLRQ